MKYWKTFSLDDWENFSLSDWEIFGLSYDGIVVLMDGDIVATSYLNWQNYLLQYMEGEIVGVSHLQVEYNNNTILGGEIRDSSSLVATKMNNIINYAGEIIGGAGEGGSIEVVRPVAGIIAGVSAWESDTFHIHGFGSGSLTLYIYGLDELINDIPLYIHGQNYTCDNSLNLYIGDLSSSGVDNSIDLFIYGEGWKGAPYYNGITLWVGNHGVDSERAALPLFICSALGNLGSGLPLYTMASYNIGSGLPLVMPNTYDVSNTMFKLYTHGY